jgi:cell division protein FtsB
MSRLLFVVFFFVIVVLSLFLGYSTYNVHYLVKANEKAEKTLDSIKADNEFLKMNLDKQIFIIEQLQDIYPKQVDKIIKETE